MKINSIITNKNRAYLLTLVIVLLNLITILLPLFILVIFPTSNLTNVLFSFPLILIFVFAIILLLYITIVGVYLFEFNADNYIIYIKSRRTISSYFYTKSNYLEMPISTIEKYALFNRRFTFNSTLMIKIRLSERRVMAKRFNFAFLSKKQKEEMTTILEKIVENNRANG